jgi:hypothetical protein
MQARFDLRRFFGIGILCLILLITQTIAHTTSQTSQEDPFSEGSNWTYELIKNSNTKGTGKYKGSSTTIEISKGLVNVTKSNSTVLIIEDSRNTYYNSSGTRFFKHEKSENISQTMITTIDRQTLTIQSRKIKSGTNNHFIENKSMVGKPSIYFISTHSKEALNVKCFWGNEDIICSINQGSINPHDNNSSLITLNYSGPKMVIMQTVTSFPKEGTSDCTFNYDENTGLLLSYTANETAKHSEGSCCWIKTDKIETYDVHSISLWTPQEVSNPQMNESSEYAFDDLQIIIFVIGISAMIIIGYVILYRRRTEYKAQVIL